MTVFNFVMRMPKQLNCSYMRGSFGYLYVHHGYLRLELNSPVLFTRFALAGVDHKIAEEAVLTNHRRDLASQNLGLTLNSQISVASGPKPTVNKANQKLTSVISSALNQAKKTTKWKH